MLPWVDGGGQTVLAAGDAHTGQWVALAGGGSAVGRGRGCSRVGCRVGYLAEIRGHERQRRKNIKNTKECGPAAQEAVPCMAPARGRWGPRGAGTARTRWLLTGFLFYIKNTWF